MHINMISHLVTVTESFIKAHGVSGIFIASILEEVVIPIPSSFVMTTSGFLFLSGQSITFTSLATLLLKVALPISLGLTLGSLVTYSLAYKFGRPAIEKIGKFFHISWKDVEKVQNYFNTKRSDEFALFVVRALPILPSIVVNLFCGVVRLNVRSYIIATFFGSLLRGFVVSFLGWQAGRLYVHYAYKIDTVEKFMFYSVLLLIIGLFVGYKISQKRKLHKIDSI